ncbi:mnl1p [Saccharomyces arboricola H-6]|uniref:alpha-1,2-Mannosidase n=1 Tax=Saccharomyces arboricola (strain H-6 / AS 2.3317 / CBS 10644) TaxID=1160507 RepID=J8LMP7_SACAR|nr:mnl1p [Saccharomyces arboricola H-6]
MVSWLWLLLVSFLQLEQAACEDYGYSFTSKELKAYKQEVKELFYFGFDNYLEHGYPFDEVRPISCVPKKRNFEDPNDRVTNDILGNFTITLIDSLTTIAVLQDKPRFLEAVRLVERTFPKGEFDVDSTVQVFETTIRVIGSLLSSHLYSTDPTKAVYLGNEYDGSLLALAQYMADRLLPAYLTHSGLPVPRIKVKKNLKVPDFTDPLSTENNVAAMACPMFEFTMLSYLTGDSKYEKVTRYAFDKTWSLRTDLNLLPMSFHPNKMTPYTPMTGVGASIDSFFEYALKGAVLFDDSELMGIWNVAYQSLKTNCKNDWFFTNVMADTGQLYVPWIDSLSAFFPGLQVLAGDVDDAIAKHLMFLKIWNTFGGIPERWLFRPPELFPPSSLGKSVPFDLNTILPLEWYPLRPEFFESTYFLYRATKDPFYLNIGVHLLRDLKQRFKSKCGFAGFQNVITGELQDRMETFVLSETLKYLYLLFDEGNEIHRSGSEVVFSTEAHPMWLPLEVRSKYKREAKFNDSTYVAHLEACYERDKELRAKEDTLRQRIIGFAKSIFSQDQADTNEDTAYDILDHKSNNEIPDSCPIRPRQATAHDSWYSPMLSKYKKLFEIDTRHADTLIKPSHMQNYSAIELEHSFYNRWSDPQFSTCQIMPTTEIFELLFDLPGLYRRVPITSNSNDTITFQTFGGRSRLNIEKMQIYKIGQYGDLITALNFQNISRRDLYSHYCDTIASLYSPTFLYRVVAINGDTVPFHGMVQVEKHNFVSFSNDTAEPDALITDSIGINDRAQLMIECTPIVNLILV